MSHQGALYCNPQQSKLLFKRKKPLADPGSDRGNHLLQTADDEGSETG